MDINQVADLIIEAALKEGIIVHKYSAVTSKSVYIKFDYGIANSLRISDHNGYSHLKYRFNLLEGKKGKTATTDKYPRFYYGFDAVDMLIWDIKKLRAEKKSRFGLFSYHNNMLKEQARQKAGATKFWRGAKLIGGDMNDDEPTTRQAGPIATTNNQRNGRYLTESVGWWNSGAEGN